MIRFQICIFDILNTAGFNSQIISDCCDSLSNLYLWHIKYSSTCTMRIISNVVIRFQICIFDILNTAINPSFKVKVCCDSLSNLYLWHIKYSKSARLFPLWIVVIRFQICIFDILNTAIAYFNSLAVLLWFAFKFVSLTY